MLINLLRYDYWLDPLARWRLGPLAVLLLAGAILALWWLRQARAEGFLADIVAALSLDRIDATRAPPQRRVVALWLLTHALLMAITFVNLPPFGWPWLLGLFPVPLLLALAPTLRHGRSGASRADAGRGSAVLALFGPVYAVSLLSAFRLPLTFLGPLSGLLYAPFMLILCAGSAIAAGLRQAFRNVAAFNRAGVALLASATLVWAIWAAAALRTHGVTGSDPYAYAQMGVDLAERGTVAHAFPLVESTYALGIDSHPVTHVGYRIPTDARRIAPTVWPVGYAWFSALAWRLGGEGALYALTPLFNLLALGLTLLLGRHLTAHILPGAAPVVGALSAMLLATSLLQVTWQMVPMADIAAQVFSIGALLLALRPKLPTLSALLCGSALGMAFNIRYTQVLIAPGLALAIWLAQTDASRPARLRAIALCAGAALLTVLPTFWHHWVWFGHPLVTGSDELANFSVARMPETLLRTLGELGERREFGFLAPLLLIGAVVLARRDRRVALSVLAFGLPVFVFHLFYDYLRPRDLLSLLPLGAVCAALGIAATWHAAEKRGPAARFLAVMVLSALCMLRGMETLAMPVTRGFGAFGYLTREQRASFDALARLTEPDAAIACSLNSGAVDLHAGRLAFRPEIWSADALLRFTRDLRQRGRPVYLLLDGDALAAAERTLAQHFTLTETARLDLPYFVGTGGGSENRAVRLVRLAP